MDDVLSKFNKKSTEAAQQQRPAAVANVVTRISLDSEIRQGVLVSSNDIRIDGHFYGLIVTKGKVILGEHAVFKGDIICQNADIYGTMEGNLVIGELLNLMSTSRFSGEVSINKLGVENGSKFDGACKIISREDYEKIATEYITRIEKENPASQVSVER